MFSRVCSSFLALTFLASATGFMVAGPAGAQNDQKTVLKGSVNKEGVRNPAGSGSGGPSLNRSDLNRVGDPFSGAPQAAPAVDDSAFSPLDAPQKAFTGFPDAMTNPHKQKRGFGLNAQTDDFSGTPMTGMPDGGGNLKGMPGTMGMVPPSAPPAGNPAGEGGPPGMGGQRQGQEDEEANLGWDEWHRRVAEAIYQRWIGYNNPAFKNVQEPLMAYVSYTVTRQGQIQDVKFLQKSNNVMFNALILQVVKSFNGDSQLLQFPDGSRRAAIENYGTFSQNYHLPTGFRHVTGDAERVKIQGGAH